MGAVDPRYTTADERVDAQRDLVKNRTIAGNLQMGVDRNGRAQIQPLRDETIRPVLPPRGLLLD